MSDSTYHPGMRALQDRFDTRRLADRLDEKLGRNAFTDQDKAFIESRTLFFLATADAEGRPDCSYKGGVPGFVRVTGPSWNFPATTAMANSAAWATSAPMRRCNCCSSISNRRSACA